MDSRLRRWEIVGRIVLTGIETGAEIAAVVAVRAEAVEEAVAAGQVEAVDADVVDLGTKRTGHGFSPIHTDEEPIRKAATKVAAFSILATDSIANPCGE
jgi:hypothetical protein